MAARDALLEKITGIMEGVLPATPDDGPVDRDKVKAALAKLGALQSEQAPDSEAWSLIGDYAESLVPALGL